MAAASTSSTATNGTPAEYNTGFFSSPDDLTNAANLANATVQSIDGVASSTTSAPATWATQWAAFKALWDKFYADSFGQGSTHVLRLWLTSDLEGQLVQFEGEIATWGAQAQTYGATVPGGVPQVQDNSLPDWLPSSGAVITIGLIVLGTIIAWKVL
jgi:hypothetical protein